MFFQPYQFFSNRSKIAPITSYATTFSCQPNVSSRSKIPPKLSDASFKKHEIGNPLLVPPFESTGVAA